MPPVWTHIARILVVALATLPRLCLAEPATVSTVCAACHGVDGNSQDVTTPRLAGLGQEYLMRQLKAFAEGQRRHELMSPIIEKIDQSEFAGLALHYSLRKPARGSAGDATLAAIGQAIYEDGNPETGVPACAGCHQQNAHGNARFPRLAGQHRSYVIKQLEDYKSGRRATDRFMVTIGQRLTTAEIRALAEYIGGL